MPQLPYSLRRIFQDSCCCSDVGRDLGTLLCASGDSNLRGIGIRDGSWADLWVHGLVRVVLMWALHIQQDVWLLTVAAWLLDGAALETMWPLVAGWLLGGAASSRVGLFVGIGGRAWKGALSDNNRPPVLDLRGTLGGSDGAPPSGNLVLASGLLILVCLMGGYRGLVPWLQLGCMPPGLQPCEAQGIIYLTKLQLVLPKKNRVGDAPAEERLLRLLSLLRGLLVVQHHGKKFSGGACLTVLLQYTVDDDAPL